MKKYKMTGCAKFFIFLVILAPIAYLGASYLNGEDGIATFKSWFDKIETSADRAPKRSNVEMSIQEHQQELRKLRSDVDSLSRRMDKWEAASDQNQ